LSAPVTIRLIDEFGLPAQGKEGYLFALLGYLSVHGLPGTIASATGAREASILGSLTPGRSPLRLPEPATVAPRRLVVR
jgi:anhydro-N-acetylmuramic acid kinase